MVTVVAVVVLCCEPRPAWRGVQVVVCDLSTMDSVTQQETVYGNVCRACLQACAVRALLPRPAVAFFLRVGAGGGYLRKTEHCSIADLATQGRRYDEQAAREPAIRVLDGNLAPLDLATAISVEVRAGLQDREPTLRVLVAAAR